MSKATSCLLGILAAAAAPAWSQEVDQPESLCNPCVDPPAIRRENFRAVEATTVVTAEDMRNLGVISVADMVNQLSAATSSEDVPFNPGATMQRLDAETSDLDAEGEPEKHADGETQEERHDAGE